MIKYRTLLRERNKWAMRYAARRTAIRNKTLIRDSYAGSKDWEKEQAALLDVQINMWDADRALIDAATAANVRTMDKVYEEFEDLTETLRYSGRLPTSPRPINHEFDNRYNNHLARSKDRMVIKLTYTRDKYLNAMRRASKSDPTDRYTVRRWYDKARAEQCRLLAYRRLLMRKEPPREETYAERKARENKAKLEAVRDSTLLETGKITEADLLDQRQRPAVTAGDPIEPPETFIQRKIREIKERKAAQEQQNDSQ